MHDFVPKLSVLLRVQIKGLLENIIRLILTCHERRTIPKTKNSTNKTTFKQKKGDTNTKHPQILTLKNTEGGDFDLLGGTLLGGYWVAVGAVGPVMFRYHMFV